MNSLFSTANIRARRKIAGAPQRPKCPFTLAGCGLQVGYKQLRVAKIVLGGHVGADEQGASRPVGPHLFTPDERTRFDAIEWENKFLLTEAGKYPVDLGVFVELEVPRDRREGFEFRFGPLLQTDFGRIQVNANLFLKRQVRVGANSDPQVTEFHYQLQTKYRLMREFEFGVQAFGELGKWNHWDSSDKQNHRIGPAIFGKIPTQTREAIRYDFAWLLGASKTAPDSTVRLQLEYEF